MDQLLSGAAFGALSGGDSLASGFLVAPEAERMIEELRAFPIEDVGSPAWTRQRENLERLNVQAHHNATTHSDEFVKEFLVSHDKVRVLVHELLVIEAWKDRVFPHFGPDAMDQSMTNMNVYLAHYHEATLCNLLEVTFFHQDACEAAGDDALLELTDYCHRKLVYLNAKAAADAEALGASQDRSADEMLKLRPHQEFEDKARDVRFGTACCALTVLRYLTDYVNQTPLRVMAARMLDTHDTQMLLVPLLEERPWVRRRKNPSSSGGRPIVEVFSDGRWTEQPREDRLQLTKCDGQTWLALNNLTVDAKCRAPRAGGYDDHRKGTMERVKRHFNEVLFDQLPVLRDLQRVLDEILLMVAPPSHEVTQGRLILEVVPETRDAILKKSDAVVGFAGVATAGHALRGHPRDARRGRRQGGRHDQDVRVHDGDGGPRASGSRAAQTRPAAARGRGSRGIRENRPRRRVVPLAPVRHGLGRRQTSEGGGDNARRRVRVRDEGRATDPSTAGADAFGARAHGEGARGAAAASAASAVTPAPHDGKVIATFGRSRAEALLDLPAPGRVRADVVGGGAAPGDFEQEAAAVAQMAEMPSAVWVTVGLLARDGFALQVKLKRTPGVHEAYRCAKTGLYWVYEPAGGAVTTAKK